MPPIVVSLSTQAPSMSGNIFITATKAARHLAAVCASHIIHIYRGKHLCYLKNLEGCYFEGISKIFKDSSDHLKKNK